MHLTAEERKGTLRWRKPAQLIAQLMLLLGFVLPLQGQEYLANVREFTTKDGLSNSQVLSLLQDSTGFIWIGTKYGLHRFDGHHFRVFTKESHGLQSNIVNQLLQGPKGGIWVIRFQESYGRLEYYSIDLLDPITEKVTTFEELNTELPFSIDQLWYVHSLPDGLLFQISDGRFFRMGKDLRITPLSLPISFRYIGSTNEGQLFGQMGSDAVLFTLEGQELRRILLEDNMQISRMAQDDQGNMWCIGLYAESSGEIIQSASLVRFARDGTITRVGEEHKLLKESLLFFIKNSSTLLLVSGNKILKTDLSSDRGISMKSQLIPVRSITYPADVIMDQNNSLWIGDYFSLRLFDLENSRFDTWLNKGEKYFSVRGMTLIGDELLVMSEGGPRTVDLQTGADRPIMDFLEGTGRVNPFPIQLTRDGRIITGANELIEVDRKLKLKAITTEAAGLGKRIWNFCQTNEGKFWATKGVEDIVIVDEDLSKGQAFEKYNGFDELRGTFKWYFLEDGEYIWISAQNGLYLVHKEKGIIAQYGANAPEGYHLPAIIFHHIHKEAPGKYWLSTGDGGLIRFECLLEAPQDFSYKQYARTDGLPSTELYACLPDERGNLWISSSNGLIQFDPKSETSMVYFEDQGVSNNEFNRLAYYRHTDGRLFFGSINGVTSFQPEDLYKLGSYQIPLKVSSANVFSLGSDSLRSVLAEVRNSGSITLRPQDNFLNLEFSLQDYYFSNRSSYSYRIPGSIDNWTDMKDNSLQLAGLPYGTHTLEVRARGRMNRVSTEPLVLGIEVLPPFYFRWWFIVLALITGGFTVWQYTSLRNRSLVRRKIFLEKMVAERTRKIEEDKQLIEEQAEQLRELDVMKSRFFENVSHELRTPLTLILGPLEKVLRRNRLENQDFTLLSLMKDNATRLHKRINELLDLSRIDAVRMTLHTEPVDLYSFVKRIIAQFEDAANMKKIGITLEFQLDQSIRVLVDPDKLEKILYNLMSNALKFTPENGRVGLTCAAGSGQLVLRVSDTGIGIPHEDLPRIFERFHRAKTDEHYEGTGIGLALCKELTELMEGDISVKSEAGKGSVFEIRIPLKETFDEVPALAPIDQETDLSELSDEVTDISGEPILLVEDNASLREYLRITLDDFHVKTAGDGREALQILGEGFRPALIITDVMMPVMDGMELLRAIRESDEYALLPVIMLTAKSGSIDKIEALRIGVDDYLTKPFVEEELIARVHTLIRNSRNRIGAGGTAADQEGAPEAEQAPFTRADLKWLEEVEGIIIKHVGDPMFGIEQLADQLHMSTRRVQQRIKAISGLTPKQYQREIQLDAARRLLESGNFQSVAEVSQEMGFSDPHYFSKLYEKRFGKRPSDYL